MPGQVLDGEPGQEEFCRLGNNLVNYTLKMITMNTLRSGDQIFLEKLTKLVVANLSREDFDVRELASGAGMSRSSVHRRLRQLRNQNASQFIREIRLQKAMEMLEDGSGTASEIAYKVGFGSPAYFTKCFHEYYGFPPGEARKRANNEEAGNSGTNRKEDHGSQAGRPVTEITRAHERTGIRRKPVIAVALITALAVFVSAMMLSHVFSSKSKKQSIVVLPFRNLSNNPDNQYFADGIMEDILNNLCHISDLRVISRTTSEHFRETDLTSGDIAQAVGVRNVLEGSIRREGNRIRLSVQLIDAVHDQHLWAQNYDRDITDLLDVQGDIAMQIANRLRTVITDSEARLLKETPTASPEAYDNYLRARFLLHKANSNQRFDISREGLLSSLKYYEEAIAIDTDFSKAYAGLANAWYNLCAWGWYKPYMDGIEQARHYCALAIDKDPDCAEAHAVNGALLIYPDHRFEEAGKELQISIDLDPGFSTAHQWYAQLLMITGPIREARKQVDIAVELEPYFWVVQNLNSWIYYFEEKYVEGLEACKTARDLNPASTDNIWLFILHYAKLGEAEKVAEELKGIFRLFPDGDQYAGEVMDVCTGGGVEGIFNWLVRVNKTKPLPIEGLNGHPFYIAWWYAITGDREQSVSWLEKTLDEKKIPLHYFNLITTNPDFDILRNDPRFKAVLEKAGLGAYDIRPSR